MASYKLLIVDDDAINLEATRTLLMKNGYLVDTARSGDEAIKKVSANPTQYALALLDFRMDGKNGAETAREILAITKDIYILIVSGDDSRDALKATWEAGAVDFLEKAKSAEFFLSVVAKWCRAYEETIQPALATRTVTEEQKLIASLGMIGRSPGLAQIARRIHKYQEEGSELNVLILGENGSGKELIAKALHELSPRSQGPFVALDAGALPEHLVESELFGHEKGAFTGAEQKRVGSFQFAEKGTLFLDEIGNTSLNVQAKLLRALQNRTIRSVGSNREIKIDVRVIAATNMDLKKAIREGKFREDLYYRLKGVTVAIPALRERPEDIELLVETFCERYNESRKKTKSFLLKAIRMMERYPWPGNVRELENTVLQLLTESYTDKIGPEHLADVIPSEEPAVPSQENATLKTYLDEVTRNYVLSLMRTSRSKMEAAQKAGMAETTFRDLLKRLGLANLSAGEGQNEG